jgi:lipoic acid synthetase
MRRPVPPAGRGENVRRLLDALKLETVCRGARCPNQAECFSRGTATFMILGDACTRNCRFCAVPHTTSPPPPRTDEPAAVAKAAAEMQLRHVVVTSVTRDDLADGGAGHFAATIQAVRDALPEATVEVLTPDFLGNADAVDAVLAAGPDVFNHNTETVPRLYASVRPQASYRRSLDVLARAAAFRPLIRDGYHFPGQPSRSPSSTTDRVVSREGNVNRPELTVVKSGLMVGLGETADELAAVFADLRAAGVEVLTIGQYLAPSADHAPVAEFVSPQRFADMEKRALDMGFSAVAAGPYVRSSYLAEDVYQRATRRNLAL